MTDLARQASTAPALAESVADLTAASLAPQTKVAYASALKGLEEFRAGRPLTDDLLAAYITKLHNNGRAPAVAALVLCAVKLQANLLDLPSPVGPSAERVMAGIRRLGRDRGRGQVDGIRWEQADAAAALAASAGTPAGLRDAALISTGSDALLRVSEIAALDVGDLVAEDDGSGRLTIRHSKTDQEGIGAVQYVGPPTVRRLRAWLDLSRIGEGALFRPVRQGGAIVESRLSVQSIRKIVRARAAAAGIEGRISGHSLRVGAAQSLAAAGASLVQMQTDGRWRSPTMPAHYARAQIAGQSAVAKLRYGGRAPEAE